MNLQKHVWEGWTVQDFIDELEQLVEMAVSGISHFKTIENKEQLKEFCKDNQPYYKKHIPEVVNYFAQKYNLK
jgi:hypothetical protein